LVALRRVCRHRHKRRPRADDIALLEVELVAQGVDFLFLLVIFSSSRPPFWCSARRCGLGRVAFAVAVAGVALAVRGRRSDHAQSPVSGQIVVNRMAVAGLVRACSANRTRVIPSDWALTR